MSDLALRDLERRAAVDASLVPELEAERLRAGLGWHGEKLRDGLAADPDQRNVYVWHGMEFVFVPAGESEAEVDAELGAAMNSVRSLRRTVFRVGAFYVGRYPVTNDEVGRILGQRGGCIDQEDCLDNLAIGDGAMAGRSGGSAHPDAPATDWSSGSGSPRSHRTFCARTGTRLPTLAEWRRAAVGGPNDHGVECGTCGGPSGPPPSGRCPRCAGSPGRVSRPYPWGTDEPTTKTLVEEDDAPLPVVERRIDVYRHMRKLAGIQSRGPSEIRVPARPDGASPFGVQDAFGNVWEVIAGAGETVFVIGGPAGRIVGPEGTNGARLTGYFPRYWEHGPDHLITTRHVGLRVVLDP